MENDPETGADSVDPDQTDNSHASHNGSEG